MNDSATTDSSAQSMTVLLATDGSECAQVATDLVRSITWPKGTVIHLVTVLETVDFLYSSGDKDEIGGVTSDLRTIAASLESTGARIETGIVGGRPASGIVDKADLVRADLIVVGSRGHGRIGSMVLGSVSAEVADHAHCPVLVARKRELGRVILATDGSSYARAAEDLLASWPMFERSPIEVLSVANISLPWTSSLALSADASTEDYATVDEQIVADHQQLATEAATRLADADRATEFRVLQGDPAGEIVRICRETEASLVVTGTHGATGLRRLLAGSVARNVMLHAPCSVMVVRQIRAPASAQAG